MDVDIQKPDKQSEVHTVVVHFLLTPAGLLVEFPLVL